MTLEQIKQKVQIFLCDPELEVKDEEIGFVVAVMLAYAAGSKGKKLDVNLFRKDISHSLIETPFHNIIAQIISRHPFCLKEAEHGLEDFRLFNTLPKPNITSDK